MLHRIIDTQETFSFEAGKKNSCSEWQYTSLKNCKVFAILNNSHLTYPKTPEINSS